MSSFTPEQVSHFRQVFAQFNDETLDGINHDSFIPAVESSLREYNFAGLRPSHESLEDEFWRLANAEGVVQWQQFFQVLIHLNLRQSASPAPEPAHVQFDVVPTAAEEAAPPSYDQVLDQQVQESSNTSNTLGRQLLRSVGGFFGLTEASQRGGHGGEIGWQEFNERNIEDQSQAGLFPPLPRRSSLGRRPPQQRPPSYPAVAAGRSFDLAELGDDSSDEEEMGLTTAPPPQYLDVIEPSGVGEVAYPAPTYPAHSSAAPAIAAHRPQELIYDKSEAWDYYLKYAKAEKRLRHHRNQTDAYEFFGTASDGESVGITRGGSVRRERLNSQDQAPVVRRPKKIKKSKLQRQSTFIRREVESLPTFWPVFIVAVSIAQLLLVIVLLPIYGLAPIDVFPVERTEDFPSLLTSNDSNVTYFRSVNLWIGLTPLNLIRLGAKFSPCMRGDFGILQTINTAILDETLNPSFGCCQNRDNVGNSLPNDCISPIHTPATRETFFVAGTRCSNPNSSTSGANFLPCCISITGQCVVMDLEQCTARGGFFHPDVESCDQVNCFKDVCGFNGALIGEDTDPATGEPNPLAPNPQQFWRFFTATYMHLGVIHVIIIIPIQLYIGIKIERTIGWLRVGIIYTLSGVGGNLLSAIFIPYGVNAGASGAVFGLLGVLYVELFQFWQIVDRAWLELIKLTAFVVFLLALGTLPYVDNMAHIGGLLVGVPSSIIFVPYITFGKWDAFRKRILLVICLPFLIALFLVGFLTFYLIRRPDFCSFCHYINCIPYSSNICPEVDNPESTLFSL